jgi:hypothetical protein
MKLFDKLSEDNFVLYAARHYYKPNVIDAEEFYDDLKRFIYLRRLLKKYYGGGELSERLILNHIIVIFNLFGVEPSLKMLDYQIENKYWPIVKPFLVYLRHIHNNQYTQIDMDKEVIERLRKI